MKNVARYAPLVLLIVGATAFIILRILDVPITENQRKRQEAEWELTLISEALRDAELEYGTYYSCFGPSAGQPRDSSLSATEFLDYLRRGRAGGPILLRHWQDYSQLPVDPWGRDYHMILPIGWDQRPIFYSAGPNGIDERCAPGTDDITAPADRTGPNKAQ